MTQQSFVRLRQNFWNEFENTVRGGRKAIKKRAPDFPKDYRELTGDLNTARANGFDPSIIERLNALVLEGNEILYGSRSFSLRGAADFVLKVFPAAVRSRWRSLGAALLIFYGLAVFSCLICVVHPGLAYDFLGGDAAGSIESMYDPESPHFLTPRDVSSDADMFGYYIYNNISIAFRTFAGGILAGFGSLLFLMFNAVFLGAAAGHIINLEFENTFFPFIIAHSAFELNAIVFSAQAGLILGYRLFITRGLTRGASIKEAGKSALPIIAGASLMLFIAACIEAFWSSRYQLPPFLRYGAGAALWVLVLVYFIFAGREKK
jgi:uncharacterized membrane protein SpoIIM required for sporulation